MLAFVALCLKIQSTCLQTSHSTVLLAISEKAKNVRDAKIHVQLAQIRNNVSPAELATNSNLDFAKRYVEMVLNFLKPVMTIIPNLMMDALKNVKLKNNGLVKEVLHILRIHV